MILRDTNVAFEVFMVKRHQEIDFASGALVFPGGKLDVQDSNPALLATCSEQNFDLNQLAVRICGIRETFEEAGILLARDNIDGKIIGAARCSQLVDWYREPLHNRDITLLEIVRKENLTLACDELVLFAHWVTPSYFSRRFDAFFFIAKAPLEQIASHDKIESVDSVWITPNAALNDANEGRKTIVFATRMNLQKLTYFQSTSALIQNSMESEVYTVEPQVEENDGDVTFTIPIEAGYGLTKYTECGGPTLKIKSDK